MITYTDNGTGRTFLLLHGGAGPFSVAGFGALLAPDRVIVPTHPGFNGTERPAGLTTVRELAARYVALLDELGLEDVTVVGNSIGGWIAAEIAVLNSPRVSGVVIVNGVGIVVPGHPVTDVSALSIDQIADYSYHRPDAFRVDPGRLSDGQRAALAGNMATLRLYAGRDMADPTLVERLGAVRVPVLVLWGLSDRLVDREYGKAYAAAIPTAMFQPLPETGHLPQLESPERTLAAVRAFGG
jgi:pimeloyl-ACP methyl ester carboxylesterase